MERIDNLGIKDLKIIQDTDYFLFGIDSVVLANIAKDSVKKSDIVLDLGTGTSVISTIIAGKSNPKKIIGIEIQKEMVNLANKNISMNNLQEKICILNEDIKNIEKIEKQIIEITGKEKVDIIVTNPPYKEKGTGTQNDGKVKYIARHEAMCELEDIFIASSKLLKYKGKLFIVHKPERIVDLLTLGRKYNLEPKEVTFMKAKIKDKPSLVYVAYVYKAGVECKIGEDIIEYDEEGNYTRKLKKMYESNK